VNTFVVGTLNFFSVLLLASAILVLPLRYKAYKNKIKYLWLITVGDIASFICFAISRIFTGTNGLILGAISAVVPCIDIVLSVRWYERNVDENIRKRITEIYRKYNIKLF